MEKLEIVNLYGKDIVVNIKISKTNSRKLSIVGGHIYMSLKENYKINDLVKTLQKIFTEKKIKEFYSQPYYTDDYVDILGTRRRLVNLSKGQVRSSEDDFVVNNEKDLEKKLKSLSKDILTSRVRKYSEIMNVPVNYDVKITSMRAAVGKNYYTKNLLTFDKILIHYSLEIIDSVVIHELTHYFVQNHSKDFYDILLKYMPNYRKIRQKLINGVRS